MYNIKPGNDLTIRWTLLHTDGTPFPLVNYVYRLFYGTGRGKFEETMTGTVEVDGNVLIWTFTADRQTVRGEYDLQLKIMFDGHLIATMNKDNAFCLSDNGRENISGQVLNITSYCDYIPLQEAIQQMRHATDAAVAATLEARAAAAEITYIPLLTSAGLAPYVGRTSPIASLYALLSADTLSQIVDGTVRRVKIDNDIYAVTQAGLISRGFTFTLASVTFGVPMDGQNTPPYVFVVHPEAGFFTLTEYSF